MILSIGPVITKDNRQSTPSLEDPYEPLPPTALLLPQTSDAAAGLRHFGRNLPQFEGAPHGGGVGSQGGRRRQVLHLVETIVALLLAGLVPEAGLALENGVGLLEGAGGRRESLLQAHLENNFVFYKMVEICAVALRRFR